VQNQSNSKRYIFQADAIGVAGQTTHPFKDIIAVQAATALPSDGGFGSARVEGFRHKEILSFASAYTEVVGTEGHPGIYEILSLSVVEKFNLLDVVTCDRIVARLTSKCPSEGNQDSQPAENSIVPIGSHFEGLRIGNRFFERLEVAPDFFCQPEFACWSGLRRAVEQDRERALLAPLSLPGPGGSPALLPVAGQRQEVLGFCIALEPKPEAVLGAPLCVQIPQFGTVHLGEFFCYPTSRSLTMLRVELGCPVQGGASAAAVGGGGRSYP
jgi:hypothetical protein